MGHYLCRVTLNCICNMVAFFFLETLYSVIFLQRVVFWGWFCFLFVFKQTLCYLTLTCATPHMHDLWGEPRFGCILNQNQGLLPLDLSGIPHNSPVSEVILNPALSLFRPERLGLSFGILAASCRALCGLTSD